MNEQDITFFEELIGDSMDKGFGREYNMFCCRQAVIFAEALITVENIKKFKEMGVDEQKALVPGMDDGHSGNTFGMSCALVMAYAPVLHRDKTIDKIIN